MARKDGIDPNLLKMPPVNRQNLQHMRKWGDADERIRAVKDAYLRMAHFYRPEAPSDGFGNIQLDDDGRADPVRLEMEGWLAGLKWRDADDRMDFSVQGCADFRNVPAMYLMLQAAQLCCSGPEPAIRKLLQMAIEALPKEEKK